MQENCSLERNAGYLPPTVIPPKEHRASLCHQARRRSPPEQGNRKPYTRTAPKEAIGQAPTPGTFQYRHRGPPGQLENRPGLGDTGRITLPATAADGLRCPQTRG